MVLYGITHFLFFGFFLKDLIETVTRKSFKHVRILDLNYKELLSKLATFRKEFIAKRKRL